MDSKKISFGFNKSIKKPSIFTAKEEVKNDIQLIDCLEGQSIKVIGAEEKVKGPLVIPLRDDAKNLLDRVREARRRDRVDEVDLRPDSELTLDELAARQLLREAKTQTTQNGTKIQTVPLSADKLPLNGEKEPTLEDYENVPISDFGFAMLRGMGWKDGMIIGKNQEANLQVAEPELRPKGLGLGATKMVAEKKPKIAVDKEGKELQLVKGAYTKIIAGAHKGKYGEVQGLDDESGRIIIRTTISQEILSLNEFLVVPVTREEYEKCSKILNMEKYEEHKSKHDNKSTSKTDHNHHHRNSPRKDRSRSPSDSSEDRSRRKREPSRKKNKKNHRSRSRSTPRSKSGKSRHRNRDRSSEDDAKRCERSESSESDRGKRKKKSKKSKRERRGDSDNDHRRSRKSKKSTSRRVGDSDS